MHHLFLFSKISVHFPTLDPFCHSSLMLYSLVSSILQKHHVASLCSYCIIFISSSYHLHIVFISSLYCHHIIFVLSSYHLVLPSAVRFHLKESLCTHAS